MITLEAFEKGKSLYKMDRITAIAGSVALVAISVLFFSIGVSLLPLPFSGMAVGGAVAISFLTLVVGGGTAYNTIQDSKNYFTKEGIKTIQETFKNRQFHQIKLTEDISNQNSSSPKPHWFCDDSRVDAYYLVRYGLVSNKDIHKVNEVHGQLNKVLKNIGGVNMALNSPRYNPSSPYYISSAETEKAELKERLALFKKQKKEIENEWDDYFKQNMNPHFERVIE